MTGRLVIRAVRTGRAWGNSLAPVKRRERIAGVPVDLSEFDAWDGPIEEGQTGEYVRHTVIEPVEATDWWNLKRAAVPA